MQYSSGSFVAILEAMHPAISINQGLSTMDIAQPQSGLLEAFDYEATKHLVLLDDERS